MMRASMPSAYSVAQYLTDLRAIRSTGSATAETSFYPPLDRLLNTAGQKLKPPVLFSTQLRNQGAGMPDGGFFPQPTRQRRNAEPPILQNPERGVVEIKPADYSLDALTNEPQTLRYLKQYGLVREHSVCPRSPPAKNSFRHLEDRLEMYFASVKRIALLVADFVIYLYGLYSLTIR